MPITQRFQLKNVRGLHARAAARFVGITQDSPAEVSVSHNGQSVNGKSLMGLMMLGARHASHIEVTADGDGSEEVIDKLADLIENKFGETS